MICACKLSWGLDLGGFVLKRAMLGPEDGHRANEPGRERIAGYEITRGVPDDVWDRWYAANRNSPIVQNAMVFGSNDMVEVDSWCRRNKNARGTQRAGQVNPVTNTAPRAR
jgi:hypothetical protein